MKLFRVGEEGYVYFGSIPESNINNDRIRLVPNGLDTTAMWSGCAGSRPVGAGEQGEGASGTAYVFTTNNIQVIGNVYTTEIHNDTSDGENTFFLVGDETHFQFAWCFRHLGGQDQPERFPRNDYVVQPMPESFLRRVMRYYHTIRRHIGFPIFYNGVISTITGVSDLVVQYMTASPELREQRRLISWVTFIIEVDNWIGTQGKFNIQTPGRDTGSGILDGNVSFYQPTPYNLSVYADGRVAGKEDRVLTGRADKDNPLDTDFTIGRSLGMWGDGGNNANAETYQSRAYRLALGYWHRITVARGATVLSQPTGPHNFVDDIANEIKGPMYIVTNPGGTDRDGFIQASSAKRVTSTISELAGTQRIIKPVFSSTSPITVPSTPSIDELPGITRFNAEVSSHQVRQTSESEMEYNFWQRQNVFQDAAQEGASPRSPRFPPYWFAARSNLPGTFFPILAPSRPRHGRVSMRLKVIGDVGEFIDYNECYFGGYVWDIDIVEQQDPTTYFIAVSREPEDEVYLGEHIKTQDRG